jgi:hypothetical protein
MIYIIIFFLGVIGMACVFVPFFKIANNKINKQYEEIQK